MSEQSLDDSLAGAIGKALESADPAVAAGTERLESAVEAAAKSMRLTSSADWSILTSIGRQISDMGRQWAAMFANDLVSQRLLSGISRAYVDSVTQRIRKQVDASDLVRKLVFDVGREWQASIQGPLRRVWESALRIDWAPLFESLRSFEPSDQLHLRLALYEAGVVLAPSLGNDVRERLVVLHKTGAGAAQVSNAVSGYYSRADWERLDAVHRDWPRSPILVRRVQIVNEAAAAMRARLFTLVAPSLVPQVEGIAAEYIFGTVGGSTRLRHAEIAPRLENAIPPWAAQAVGTAAILDFLEFLDEKLFGFVDFEVDRAKIRRMVLPNRHVLVHGRSAALATRMNGLRSFLVLDLLGAVILATRKDPTG